MNSELNNEIFQNLLEEADEYELICASIYYVPTEIQQQSLLRNAEYLHEFLFDNYPQGSFTETTDSSLIETENTLFLTSLSREQKAELYKAFMSPYAIMEDLLGLCKEEREELLTELGITT